MMTTVASSAPGRWFWLETVRKHRALIVGGGIVFVLVLVALAAPWLAPYSPYEQNLEIRLRPPWFLGGTSEHILGTDLLGRDYLSRMIYGTRLALIVAFGTAAMSAVVGITLGLLGGYYGGRVDALVMFFITVRLSLPVILVALAIVGLIGSTLPIIMAVLAGLLWDRFAVVTRASVMQLRDREFVLAARTLGCSDFRILTRDILPNIAGPLTVVATLEMAHAVLLEASLSFLGLGIKPPEASWGLMIAEAKDLVFFESWVINIPGIALFVLVVGINLAGDGLQRLVKGNGP